MTKIEKLKARLINNKLDAYLIPMRDEFGCEYVPAQNKRLEFVTGFTGSNGFAIIGKEKCAFFTDGRYTLQAKIQVNKKDFEILDMSDISPEQWLANNFKGKAKIGYDAALFSIAGIKKFKDALGAKNIKLVEVEDNLVDEIWKDRPKAVTTKPFILAEKFCGKSGAKKIKEITEKIQGDALLITAAESVCWLFNIRANDLPHTPVLLAYVLITKKGEAYLYANVNATQKIENEFDSDVYLRDTKDIFKDLKKFVGKKIELDPNITAIKFKNILEKNNCEIIEKQDICLEGRAIKNDVEIKSTRTSHIRDGVALCRFLCWIENAHGKEKLNEISVADKLEAFRKQGENFYSLSFDTIAGWQGNGAIVHYRAEKKTAAKIEGDGILLIDSGAQYLDGTTDVTRTIALGKVTAKQKKYYTLVLKGHIALASQKFLKGTSGANLDILARRFLWNEELDYKHGTGHGVGFFMNVHEGPQSISRINDVPLRAGMIISNEPGYYQEGEYGIRIESLVLVAEAGNNMLQFETLTKAPIDKKLIDKSLLTQQEIDWMNDYHDDVFKNVEKFLNKEEKEWLKKATSKI